MIDTDLRAQIATAVVAALAGRDDKPCRKKSNVIEAVQYADMRLAAPPEEKRPV